MKAGRVGKIHILKWLSLNTVLKNEELSLTIEEIGRVKGKWKSQEIVELNYPHFFSSRFCVLMDTNKLYVRIFCVPTDS